MNATVLDIKQGSPEWMDARLGIPTASRFGEILTPKTLKPSVSSVKYRNQLLAEWMIGHALNWSSDNAWTERGREMEAEARAAYELERGVDVALCGFVLREDGMAGGSPDGLIGDHGGVDFKCPALHTHIGYMLDPDALADAYRMQAAGYMYLTGRFWWELYSYAPGLPPVSVRIERDDMMMDALGKALDQFVGGLLIAREKLEEYRETLRAAA